MTLEGLTAADAARLLAPDLDPVVRYRVLAEAQGNPLALIELPKITRAGEVSALAFTDRLRAAFSGQVAGLPESTRTLLLFAAAEESGDLGVILRAAPGTTVDDLRPAEEARLVEVVGGALRFRHPLVRAAIYHGAAYAQRIAAHRARRKADARTVLRRALESFDALGASPWAARTRAELEATGLRAPQATATAAAQLTPQELQIARLAASGLSNKDIAAQPFLSPKTVAYHLYKAYPKLGVAGRGDLGRLGL